VEPKSCSGVKLVIECNKCGTQYNVTPRLVTTIEDDGSGNVLCYDKPRELTVMEVLGKGGFSLYKKFNEYIVLCPECRNELDEELKETRDTIRAAEREQRGILDHFFAGLLKEHEVTFYSGGSYSISKKEVESNE